MPTRQEFRALAKSRLDEAKALYKAGHYDGAVYLCGYAVEFSLKACICKLLDISQYPEGESFAKAYKIHRLRDLKTLAGLDNKLTATNPQLFANWSRVVSTWTEEIRYHPLGTYTRVDAQEMLKSISEKPNGIMVWLSKRW